MHISGFQTALNSCSFYHSFSRIYEPTDSPGVTLNTLGPAHKEWQRPVINDMHSFRWISETNPLVLPNILHIHGMP